MDSSYQAYRQGLGKRFLVHAETSALEGPLDLQPRRQNSVGVGAEDIQVVTLRKPEVTPAERRRGGRGPPEDTKRGPPS